MILSGIEVNLRWISSGFQEILTDFRWISSEVKWISSGFQTDLKWISSDAK